MVGLAANRISKWASGQGEPTGRQYLRMARVLGVPVEYLIDDEMAVPPLTPTTEMEHRVWDVVREIGADRVWRILMNKIADRSSRFMLTIRVIKKHPTGVWEATIPELGESSAKGGGELISHAVGSVLMANRSDLQITVEVIDVPGGTHEVIGPDDKPGVLLDRQRV